MEGNKMKSYTLPSKQDTKLNKIHIVNDGLLCDGSFMLDRLLRQVNQKQYKLNEVERYIIGRV